MNGNQSIVRPIATIPSASSKNRNRSSLTPSFIYTGNNKFKIRPTQDLNELINSNNVTQTNQGYQFQNGIRNFNSLNSNPLFFNNSFNRA